MRRPAKPVTHGPFANPYLLRVMEHWGPRAFRRTSVCMEFERFMRRIVPVKLPLGLEIGTYNGISTILFSQFFERVVSITIETETPAERQIKHDIRAHLGITNIRYLDAKDNEHKRQLIQSLKFDFAYIDGDHENDTNADWELVRHCGRVLFHEYWPLQPPVWDLVESLPRAQVTHAYADCLAYWERPRG